MKNIKEKVLNGVMEQEKFVTSEVQFLQDNKLMSDLNLVTLRKHIKEHLNEAIDLTLTEAEKEFKKDLLSAYSEGHENGEKEKLAEAGKVIGEADWTDFVKDDLMEEYSEETQADDFYEDLFNKFIANKIKQKLGIEVLK